MAENNIQKNSEFVGNCVICKAPLFRGGDEPLKWYYHDPEGFVCKHHHGVEKWYQELIDKANKELKDKGVI